MCHQLLRKHMDKYVLLVIKTLIVRRSAQELEETLVILTQ